MLLILLSSHFAWRCKAAEPAAAGPDASIREGAGFWTRFTPSESWTARFWQRPEAQTLLRKTPREVADLVPVQSGVRFCRCPSCDADEREDPLEWAIENPKSVRCRKCGVILPSEKFPAKVNKEVPEEKVEVLPGVFHRYPYHTVEPSKASHPEERLYIDARRDDLIRQFLSRAALYAAARYHSQLDAGRDEKLAVLACVVILRFSQVYPAYATHFDQPGSPKYFQPADLPPPYRRGYQTGKWDFQGNLEVPLNLVIAYGLLRENPAWAEAGRLLGEPEPTSTVERSFFLPCARFASLQPEEANEDSLFVHRGMLAVGRLLGDPELIREAEQRTQGLLRQGFYHDGFWRGGDVLAHRRVLHQLDGWIYPMQKGTSRSPDDRARIEGKPAQTRDPNAETTLGSTPMLRVARHAADAVASRYRPPDILQVSRPVGEDGPSSRRPMLLGGAGLARLAIGEGEGSLDLELRGLDSLDARHYQRLAFRLLLGGRWVLDDLDERETAGNGWELATASHNTVVVDGLNQRENPVVAARPARGSDFDFFAADPDFQVVAALDGRAYPQTTSVYRHILVVSSHRRGRYGLSVFQVAGGHQHDQHFHSAGGDSLAWRTSCPLDRPPASLLPPSIVYLTHSRPDEGRWFVQAYGEFHPTAQAMVTHPTQAWLERPNSARGFLSNETGPDVTQGPGRSVRMHLLGDTPARLFLATSTDPTRDAGGSIGGKRQERASLIVRRSTDKKEPLQSTFVTLFEPMGPDQVALKRVGRVASGSDVVVIYVETPDGPEHLIVNLRPDVLARPQLLGGRPISTDGLAVRIRGDEAVLAGGTYVEAVGKLVSQGRLAGNVVSSHLEKSDRGLGWFVVDSEIPEHSRLGGRTLTVRHGDGTYRSWTIQSHARADQRTRLYVCEDPGFSIDASTGTAVYYQYPMTSHPGPHRFQINQIARR